MDLNVSPDLDAYLCYLMVLCLGVFTALAQVSRRLARLPGKWIMVDTWALFFAYAAVPVALFWLLDRTSAVHDTSLFAAILVGVGYQQILSGGLGSIRAPGEVSGFWQPFAKWADAIAARIRDRVAINSSKFDEKLLSSIVATPQKLEALRLVTMSHSQDPQALNTELAKIDSYEDALGATGVLKKKAATLYQALKVSNTQQFDYLLLRDKVISLQWYLWYAKEWRSKAVAIAVALVLFSAAITGGLQFRSPDLRASYYVWRLQKENGTEYDHYRARTNLRAYLDAAPTVYSSLAALLRAPNLSDKTADNILSIFVEMKGRAQSHNVNLLCLLEDSLRTDNSDIRERVQKTLLYLADDRHLTVPPELQNWNSDPKDTAADIDSIIKKWHQIGP